MELPCGNGWVGNMGGNASARVGAGCVLGILGGEHSRGGMDVREGEEFGNVMVSSIDTLC